MILVTGSHGLIGKVLCQHLARLGRPYVDLDWCPDAEGYAVDIRHIRAKQEILHKVTGIVHLAAVSRVICAQRAPDLCATVNIGATHALLDAVWMQPHRPWVIFASSREVYGQQIHFPVKESARQQPLNLYAASKMAGERLTLLARRCGLVTAIVRFSTVYGRADDHPDRVVPAFSAASALGRTLHVEGRDNILDITHVDDVVIGVLRVIDQLEHKERALPTLHFVSGIATTLGALAEQCIAIAQSASCIEDCPPRAFDVSRFCGDPALAERVLGWRASTPLATGLAILIGQHRDGACVM